jgi:F-type H+-transporting ATPase subunit gamma
LAQNVRAIKTRIENIEDIGQITKAMNAIAMTKVTRMKRRLAQNRPYLESLESFTRRLLGQQRSGVEPHPLMMENGSEKTAIFVLNSDRGMCGRYKGELNRAAEHAWREASPHGVLLAGGEKARSYFGRRGIKPLRSYVRVYDKPDAPGVERMADDAMDLYLTGEVGAVRLVSMRFVSDLAQRLVFEDLLPVRLEPERSEFLVEPDVETILASTLPLYVRAKLYTVILETKTSEDAIRRQAMKSATDNAEDLQKTLTRSYNRARQQSITREIADIIGGAEALRTD